MSDKKISQLTGATTPLAGTEVLPIVQSGVTKKVAVNDLTAGKNVGMANALFSNGFIIQTGGVNRWIVEKGTNDSLAIYRYNDAGGYAGNPVTIDRVSGTVRLENNLVIGTAGNGIDFSADPSAAGMTSELLDDYEEGTWTPTDASGAGLTFSVSEATYTKVGNTVRVQAFITFPSTASGAAVLLGGLPFSSAKYAIGAVRSVVACVATALSTNIYVNNPANVAITNVELTGSLFIFTVVYNV
jgi:hypothetical protein